jgi:hypothetical protein
MLPGASPATIAGGKFLWPDVYKVVTFQSEAKVAVYALAHSFNGFAKQLVVLLFLTAIAVVYTVLTL